MIWLCWNVLLLIFDARKALHFRTELGVFGFETAVFSNQLADCQLHLLRLFLLSVTSILGSFSVLHFPAIQLLFWCQVVQTFTARKEFHIGFKGEHTDVVVSVVDCLARQRSLCQFHIVWVLVWACSKTQYWIQTKFLSRCTLMTVTVGAGLIAC